MPTAVRWQHGTSLCQNGDAAQGTAQKTTETGMRKKHAASDSTHRVTHSPGYETMEEQDGFFNFMAGSLKGTAYRKKSGAREICSEASPSLGGTFIDYNGNLEPPPYGSRFKKAYPKGTPQYMRFAL